MDGSNATSRSAETRQGENDAADARKLSVTLKLYASLTPYLPEGAKRNQAQIDVASGVTARGLLDQYTVPPESCHLVLVNGIFQTPEQRLSYEMKDGDVLAVWPPVAGG